MKAKESQYQEAIQLLQKKQFEDAITIFQSLSDYSSSNEMIQETNYQKAMELMEKKDYEGAILIFKELNNYKSSNSDIDTCKYGIAENELRTGRYQEAIKILKECVQSEKVEELMSECNYLQGIDYYKKKKYEKAVREFDLVLTYKKTKSYLYKIAEIYQSKQKYQGARDIFKSLGKYQDAKKRYQNSRYYLKYAKYKYNGLNLDSYFEPYKKGEMENILKYFYGTWYDTSSGEQVKIDKYKRNGREYGIYTAYLAEEVCFVYYYLDDPKVLYAECSEYSDIDSVYGEINYLASANALSKKLTQIEYRFASITKEKYDEYYKRSEREQEQAREEIAERENNSDNNSSLQPSEQELFSIGSTYINTAMAETKPGYSYQVVGQYWAGKGILNYEVKYKVSIPSEHYTGYLTIYLVEDTFNGGYRYFKAKFY